jgi:hypothetical protein
MTIEEYITKTRKEIETMVEDIRYIRRVRKHSWTADNSSSVIITFSEKEPDVDELLNMYEQWVEKQKEKSCFK